jgi:hypothetical protein
MTRPTAAHPGGAGRTVTYDPAGNEATVGTTAYTYSARNLLAADQAERLGQEVVPEVARCVLDPVKGGSAPLEDGRAPR